nr:D-erythro-sphingosine kinase [Cryptococcus depauperatus CBS 7855]
MSYSHRDIPVILDNLMRGLLSIQENNFQVLQVSSDGYPPKKLLTCPLQHFLKAHLVPAAPCAQRRLDLHCLGTMRGTELKLIKLHVLVESTNVPEAEEWVKNVMKAAYGPIKPFKRVLILVNPVGGKGKARSIVHDTVVPILSAAGCVTDLRETTHRSHAEEIAHSMALEYDVIATASGDGLVYEVLNGLASRLDARHALKTPIAPIPTGSANAVCINLFGVKDTFNIPLASLNIIKGHHLPIDLCSVLLLPSNTRRFSFLAQAIGLMVDLDIGTENLRWMGDTRFLVGFLKGMVTNRSAKCRLMLQVEEDDKYEMVKKARERVQERRGKLVGGGGVDPLVEGAQSLDQHVNGNGSLPPSPLRSLNGDKPSKLSSPLARASEDETTADSASEISNYVPENGPIAESKPLQPDSTWLTIESPAPKPTSRLDMSPLPNPKSPQSSQGGKNPKFQPEAKTGGWVNGHGILYFYAGMMPWVARDLNQWPVSTPGDGLIDVVVQRNVPRTQMASAIAGAEKGEAFWLPTQYYYKCKAIVGENLDKVGQPIFTIDGEAYPFDSFHVEVHPRVANLLSLTGDFYTSEFLEKTDIPLPKK